MLTWVKQQLTAPTFEGDDEKTRVARLLHTVIWSALIILVVAGPVFVMVNETTRDMWLSSLLVGGFALWLLGLHFMIRKGYVRAASILFCSLLWLFVLTTTLVFGGIRSSITPAYLLTLFMAGFLLGEQGALLFGLLNILAIFGVFFAEFYLGAVLRPPRAMVAWDNVFLLSAIFGWMTVVVVLGWRNFAHALEGLQQSRENLRQRIQELRRSRETTQERTRKLERRTLQLQTAAEVARDATALRDLDALLKRTVSQIQQRFDFYHTALFLTDEAGEYAVLRTASGHAADKVMATGLRLRVGARSMVGSVTSTGEVLISSDVRDEPLYKVSPLLIETRSEAILPLRAGGDVIGALDVQSRELAAFTEDEIAVLQIVTDQLAVAIQNARLLEEMRSTVQELRAASGQYTRETWQGSVLDRGVQGYRYDRLGVAPLSAESRETTPGESSPKTLAVPLKLREEVIGTLNLRFEEEGVSPELTEFLEGVAERLVLSMENARLLEASRQRAARERLVRDITAELRASPDVEGVLRRTIHELGKALNARGAVRMVPSQDNDDERGKEV